MCIALNSSHAPLLQLVDLTLRSFLATTDIVSSVDDFYANSGIFIETPDRAKDLCNGSENCVMCYCCCMGKRLKACTM